MLSGILGELLHNRLMDASALRRRPRLRAWRGILVDVLNLERPLVRNRRGAAGAERWHPASVPEGTHQDTLTAYTRRHRPRMRWAPPVSASRPQHASLARRQ